LGACYFLIIGTGPFLAAVVTHSQLVVPLVLWALSGVFGATVGARLLQRDEVADTRYQPPFERRP
jgi:hypothetical protein